MMNRGARKMLGTLVTLVASQVASLVSAVGALLAGVL
jgi:hypothetical protein